MLFAAQVPPVGLRIAQNNATAVAANSDAPKATLFTVPTGRKFTVRGIGCDQSSASVDLIAFHIQGSAAVQLCDRQCSTLPTDEKTVPMSEEFKVGESLTIGLRNRTGSPITPALYVFYTDEPA